MRDEKARCHLLLLQGPRSAALFVLSRAGQVESWTEGAERLAHNSTRYRPSSSTSLPSTPALTALLLSSEAGATYKRG